MLQKQLKVGQLLPLAIYHAGKEYISAAHS
jgi:hypothetical protein